MSVQSQNHAARACSATFIFQKGTLMFYRVAIIAVAVLATACSDPKAANEKNFKVAIQKDLDAEYPKCYIIKNFPETIPLTGSAINDNMIRSIHGNDIVLFKALTDAGILSEKAEPHEVTPFWGKKTVVNQPTFNLTEEGKKYYKADAAKDVYGKATGGFCFGKATVRDIPEFTEPSEAGGIRVSQVKFTYQVSDFPAWAKLPETLSAVTRLKTDVESDKTPVTGSTLLKLTNNGWVNAMR
jgi:hypothetical protein